ncbi:MAG TPA: LysE family translocator [Bauldia sp.]|nr:LysE family translocator [Bauldia sp.]
MSLEIFGAFVVFALVALFTPGPNNLMLMASSLNFGFRRALPHFWGVALGFAFMVLVVGLGLGAVFAAFPVLQAIISIAGAIYILYLAWIIGTATAKEKDAGKQPVTFLQAVAFQWVNPKAWVMVIGAAATYAAVAPFPWNIILMAAVFGVGGMASGLTWLSFGSGLRRFVRDERAVRIFNVGMAIVLALSVVPVFLETL